MMTPSIAAPCGPRGFVIRIFLLLLFCCAPLFAAERDFTLNLGGASFDPLMGPPQPPRSLAFVEHDGPDLYLIQAHGPAQPGVLDALQQRDLKPIAYIYPYSYVVWGTRDALETQARADWIRWSGPFQPAWRMAPSFRVPGSAKTDYIILTVRDADHDALTDALTSLGATDSKFAPLTPTLNMIAANLPADRAANVASLPGVYTVQPVPTDGGDRSEMSDQVLVNNVDMTNLAIPGYCDWLASVGLDGTGVIAANVDGGVNDQHPDLINRMLPCEGETCAGNLNSTHGSHTAGIMVGDGSQERFDVFGFNQGLGVAPNARIFEQYYPPFMTTSTGMLQLMTESYRNGAVLSSNSWGPASTPRGYDALTLPVDVGVRDADPDAPGHQALSYFLAIMNGNGGISSQGSPDEAKNIVKVGSTWMRNEDTSPRMDIYSLSDNTAHGPCLDGRNLADLVAPGKYVVSTISGTAYQARGGTSMAAPHVAGAAMLFHQYYRELWSNPASLEPSPALVKAALLGPTRDLTGNSDADGAPLTRIFDHKQGWGRLNLDAVVAPQTPVRYFDQGFTFDQSGQGWTVIREIADETQPIYIMLVWTDAPGHGMGGSTPAWCNDLNLTVIHGEITYTANNFGEGGWSVPGGDADFKHNTEGVRLPPGVAGNVVIQVDAANIAWDGVPNSGSLTDQDFALVCYNCRKTSSELLPTWPDSNSMLGLVDEYFR